MIKMAEQLDPTSMIIKAVLAGQYVEGESELALVFANKALEMSRYSVGHYPQNMSIEFGDIDEGIEQFKESLKLNSNP